MDQAGVLDRIVSSPINYWGGFVCDVVAIVFLLYYGLTHFSSGAAACLAAGLAGLVVWSLLEYVLHRFVFHGPPSAARNGHIRHHRQPQALVGTPMLIGVSLVFILWFALTLAIPADVASFLTMGVTVGYLYFTVLHHVLHHWRGNLYYFARLHDHHEIHHRVPGVNFGSTNMFWDRVFGTFDAGRSR